MKQQNLFKNHMLVLILFILVSFNIKSTIVNAQTFNVQVAFSKQSPITVGETVNVTASVTASSNVLYKFWIYDGKNWSIVQEYSEKSNYSWTPQYAAQYKIWVDVKDKYSQNTSDSYKQVVYDVKNTVTLDSISTSLSSPIPAGNLINIKAVSKDGRDPLYRFWIFNGQAWSIIQDYSRNDTAAWKPLKSGNYKIWVDVKESTSKYDKDSYKEITYEVNDGAQITQVTFSKQSPLLLGESIDITASASASSNVLYKFWIYDGKTWSIVQDYSENNSYTWTPNSVAQYKIWVDVKDKYSQNTSDSYKQVVYDVKNTVTLDSISTSLSSPIPAGNLINIKAVSKDGRDPLYRFWIFNGQAWSIIQDYSRNDTAAWRPLNTGNYKIWVDVKESTSKYDKDIYKEIAYKVTDGAQIGDVILNKQSPLTFGESVEITASASESNNVLYKFWIYDGRSWIIVQDYSEDNSYSWTPQFAAQYKVWVDVKDKYSTKTTDSSKQVLYDVKNPVTLQSISTSLNSPVPVENSISIKADSIGGKEPLYRFWIYDGQVWRVIRDYSREDSVIWKPDKAANYKIWVDVKESSSRYDSDSYKEIAYKVIDGAKIEQITFNKQSPLVVGDLVTITASASESSNILYRFSIYDGVNWKVAKDYSTDNTYTWSPSCAAKYSVKVDVKDRYSIKEADSYKEAVYDVKSNIQFTSISTSLSSPQNSGNNIIITANSASNERQLFRFWTYDGVSWKVVRDYAEDNRYTWIPDKAGTYRIWVDVKTISSLKDYDYSKEITYIVENKPVIKSFVSDYSSPRRVGATITITTSVIYGEENLFRFWIHDGSKWSIVQDYSRTNYYKWNPTVVGKYRIWVDVKSSRSGLDVEVSKEIPFDIVKYGIMNYTQFPNTLDYYAQQQITNGKPVYSNGVSWLSASLDQVKYYLNVSNFIDDSRGIYQFLKLTYAEGITAEDLNSILVGKGVLENKGEVFLRAGKMNNVNPVYLVSHALLETGNGTSVLATGGQRQDNTKPISDTNKPVYDAPVYNMFGIGAYDSDPIGLGTTFAYNHQWFTVDDAIIGGASFIGNDYIKAGRDTLYKMRWNVDNISKQYATDIKWAYNQTYNIRLLIDQMKNSIFTFEVPAYKQ